MLSAYIAGIRKERTERGVKGKKERGRDREEGGRGDSMHTNM